MKTSYIIVTLLFTSARLFAQEEVVDLSFPLATGQKAVLNLRFADKIEVKSWNKKELFIRASVIINDGLMNEAHEIDTIINDYAIEISTGFNEEIIRGSRSNNCDGQNRTQRNNNGRRGSGSSYSVCHTINYTVFLPADTDLDIETISGDISIENMISKIDAKSISGLVDLVVAKNHRADILLESVTGRAYTEPAMFTTRDGLQSLLSRKVSGQLNGGGKRLHLESVSGNVRLRHPN
jgi:hypothetical protein